MHRQPLVVPDARAWRAWLEDHENDSDGVWLVLAKKGTVSQTTLSYDQALEEALCSGWIDGQKRARDAATFVLRFTPRRPRSTWSQRNVALVEALVEQGRMRARGHAEIERAKRDGRWERAYAGSATAEVPADLSAALAAWPGAAERFAGLSASARYPLLLSVMTAAPALRARRIEALVRRLGSPESRSSGPGFADRDS